MCLFLYATLRPNYKRINESAFKDFSMNYNAIGKCMSDVYMQISQPIVLRPLISRIAIADKPSYTEHATTWFYVYDAIINYNYFYPSFPFSFFYKGWGTLYV